MLQALPPAPPAQEIIVTGKALQPPESERAYQVRTIGREELDRAPSNRLEQILRGVPGLQLFRRSDAGSGHPTSQGVTLRSLGGNASSRALLILDGVPQSDPFGGWVNWPAYDPVGLDQVRIIRGGGSAAYGPGALAGVIALSSRSTRELEGDAEVGSRRSVEGNGYFGAALGQGLLTISVGFARSDGFVPLTPPTRGAIDERSPFHEANIRTRWVAPIGTDTELQLGALGFVDSRDRGLPFTGNRTRGADASARLVGSGKWQWSALAYGQWRIFRSSFASVDDTRTTASRVALQDSVPSRGYGGSVELRPPTGRALQLRIGADGRLTNGESREFYSYVGGEPTRYRVAGGSSQTEGLFADATLEADRLTLSGSARLDRWRISGGELRERLIAGAQVTRDDIYPSRRGWRPTARTGAVFDIGSGMSVRSAAYLGWRLPTLNELFRPFRAGPDATAANPLLKPERLAGAEAGVDYRAGQLTLSLTAFENRLSDGIANVTLGHGPGTFPGVGFVSGDYSQRQNVDSIHVRGIEATSEGHRGPWSLRLGASYARARVSSSDSAAPLDGLRPAQTPKLSLSGALAWESGGKAAAISVRQVGNQYEDDLNALKIPAATTIDAFAALPLSRSIQLVVRGENLLDKTVVAGLGSDGTVERAIPRTLWVGVRLR
jgi:outer membrane receptor protein involved in Fe transport